MPLKPITLFIRWLVRLQLAFRLSFYLRYSPRRAWLLAKREGLA
ncbi:hypothetical protein [Rhodocyclus gracilis]|nr:hypothetical protein [Rhodocyclus gracilis]